MALSDKYFLYEAVRLYEPEAARGGEMRVWRDI